MQCPKCGYLMGPLDRECARYAKTAATATADPAMPMPAPAPTRPSVPTPPPRRIRRDEPTSYGPTLGWPLTIILWIVLVLNGVVVVFGLLALALSSFVPQLNQPGMGGAVLLVTIPFAIQAAAMIGMLRCQRWGFYLYCFFTYGPLLLALAFRGFSPAMLVPGLPAIAITVLVLSRWDDFDRARRPEKIVSTNAAHPLHDKQKFATLPADKLPW